MEILPHDIISQLTFPINKNEDDVIEEKGQIPEYVVGTQSKIDPCLWNSPDRGIWTDEIG